MAKTNKVTVIEKNAGQKIDFEQSGTRLIFGDDEIMLNVCRDKSGNLTIGTGSGLRYVAQVMIPAATYTETEIPAEEPAEAPAAEDATESGDDMNQKTTVQRDKNPLDMGDVTVVLWSIE